LKKYLLFIFTGFFVSFNLPAQSRFEIDVHGGYSHPLLEAYGTDVTIGPQLDRIFVDGQRILTSDNFGTENGLTVETYLKYAILKKGQIKGLFNIGYNRLVSYHDAPGTEIGVRLQSFSLGTGLEINPLSTKRFSPSVFGLLRVNYLGGETFYYAGIDFFKVRPRYGYTAGFNLNYRLNQMLGLYLGFSYSYDNSWGKEANEETVDDPHVIVFRDLASPTNGLTSDRRLAYSSYYAGLSFYFK